MNAIPGAESLRNPGHPRFFHVRAGDKQQIEKLVSNAKAIGISRLAVLNNDQEMGLSGVQVAQDEANRVGGLQLKGMTSASDAPSITAASVKIATLNPQGVLIVGPPRFSVDAVAALRKSGVSQPLFVLSYVQPGLLIKVAGLEGARGVGISQTYPNPNNSTLPLMREFHTAMKASFPDVSHYTPFQLEGYLCARTLVEALKRIKSREVTPALLAQSLKTMGELDFGGFRVDFTKSNIGSKFVDIAVVSSEGKLLY
jgi:ABC-type branched-subunit amino acid transport system substrate-binding protein